jgi:hypothetical protein
MFSTNPHMCIVRTTFVHSRGFLQALFYFRDMFGSYPLSSVYITFVLAKLLFSYQILANICVSVISRFMHKIIKLNLS